MTKIEQALGDIGETPKTENGRLSLFEKEQRDTKLELAALRAFCRIMEQLPPHKLPHAVDRSLRYLADRYARVRPERIVK